ncbi:NAD(P)H-quinone oxidoreductase [Olivibacter sp. SDN3]|uniref:NAD(P)H-quinone oxidoreductase n=1 Tax=Olivibacter sp. SDN3 TaxID=2764720 RepID=UPI0016519048|nr:NAD(P)H-quinone oxidoreductase [Olivibacter sp. SDN3]QNL48797.1 NAD(P)H-quinone oxidoreductase [Olivibacter sp. SDN3]
MKVVAINGYGDPDVLITQEREIPLISDDEVLIQVKAAGVNRPDVFQRKGNYPAPQGVSQDIPGLEISGYIKAVGKSVEKWRVGDEVCALLAGGGYAEYVAVHGGQCLPVPKGFSFAEAAGLPETIFTVWHNVFQRGKLIAGETLLVHGGSSGIGVTAIQLAKALGAKVLATAGSKEKCQVCVDLGADFCVNYKESDFEKVFKGQAVDVILDMVGGTYFEKNINILREEGRLVYINAMKGNLVNLNIMKMMQKRITITGSTLRSRSKVFKASLANEIQQHVWPILNEGRFSPVIYKTYPLDMASSAHALMETNKHFGKIILIA